MADRSNTFVIRYSEFYKKFLDDTAKNVVVLSDLQKDFKEEYNKIKEFNNNPKALEEFIGKLTLEEQSILLKILLRAGTLAGKMGTLFELTSEDQVKFAKELTAFSIDIETSLKIAKKSRGEKS